MSALKPISKVSEPSAQHQQLKQSIAQQLAADTTELLYLQPFLAMLLMRLHICVVVDDRLQTAATDGTHIFADARFFATLSQQDRLFVLAHEVWHCAMGHFARRDFMTRSARDPKRWNQACDYEVNAIVGAQLHHVAAFALHREDFCGLSAEQIFARLNDESERNTALKQRQFDYHNPLDNSVADVSSSHSDDNATAADSQTVVLDPEFTPTQPNQNDANRWRQYTAQAAQVMRSRGRHLDDYTQLALERLLRPQLPWTSVLRRYIEQSSGGGQTWHPISRRYAYQGLIMPGQRTQSLSIAVAIDTSGSTHADLTQFFSELHAILKSFQRVKVQLIECDSQVRQHTELTERDIDTLHTWRPQGGGGTSFVPVFDYIAKHGNGIEQPNVLVFFTDGYGNAPHHAPAYPVLWVLTEDGTQPSGANWGQTVKLQGA